MKAVFLFAICAVLSWQSRVEQQPFYLVGEWRTANYFRYDTSNTTCGLSKYYGVQFTNTKAIHSRRLLRADGTGEYYQTYSTNGHMDEIPIRNPARYIRHSFSWRQSGDTLIRHRLNYKELKTIDSQIRNGELVQLPPRSHDEKYLVVAHGQDYVILSDIDTRSFHPSKNLTVWVRGNVERGKSILKDEYYILPYVKKLIKGIPGGRIHPCEDSLEFIQNTRWAREHY